jgi:hypothetical protein
MRSPASAVPAASTPAGRRCAGDGDRAGPSACRDALGLWHRPCPGEGDPRGELAAAARREFARRRWRRWRQAPRIAAARASPRRDRAQPRKAALCRKRQTLAIPCADPADDGRRLPQRAPPALRLFRCRQRAPLPTRSGWRFSTTCSWPLPRKWAWRCNPPPPRSTSRSGSISPARCSMRPARWSPMRRTCRCIWDRWGTASRASSSARGGRRDGRGSGAAMPMCSTIPMPAARTCPISP